MKQKDIIVPYDSTPHLHTESFLTKEQAEQFKDVFKNVVAVVRCRDCKHCFTDGDNVRFNVCELNHNKVQSDDWFCADGEHRS